MIKTISVVLLFISFSLCAGDKNNIIGTSLGYHGFQSYMECSTRGDLTSIDYVADQNNWYNLFGVFYRNRYLDLSLESLSSDYFKINFDLTNDNILFRTQSIYTSSLEINNDQTQTNGPGWDESYSGLFFDDAMHYYGSVELGYILCFEKFNMVKWSYRSDNFMTIQRKKGAALGLPFLLHYSLSHLHSDTNLIPEGEQEYYESGGVFKGVTIQTLGLKLSPTFSWQWDNVFVGTSVDFMLFPYSFGNIYENENTEIFEFDVIKFSGMNLYSGLNFGDLVFRCNYSGYLYNIVNIPDESDVQYGVFGFDVGIEAGYRF